MNYLHKTTAMLATLLLSFSVQATDWLIDNNNSQLSFVSTKKVNVAEVHHFSELSGSVAENGDFMLEIDLASVNTGIEIRDNRMKEFLFNIVDFPKAQVTAQLDTAMLEELAVGASAQTLVDASLSLHGKQQLLNLPVRVTKVSAEQLLVVATQPTVLNVSDYELVEGVEKLRELAGLPSISHAVPVTFYLTLNASN